MPVRNLDKEALMLYKIAFQSPSANNSVYFQNAVDALYISRRAVLEQQTHFLGLDCFQEDLRDLNRLALTAFMYPQLFGSFWDLPKMISFQNLGESIILHLKIGGFLPHAMGSDFLLPGDRPCETWILLRETMNWAQGDQVIQMPL